MEGTGIHTKNAHFDRHIILPAAYHTYLYASILSNDFNSMNLRDFCLVYFSGSISVSFVFQSLGCE